jgi:hypothetical protein
MRGLLRGRRWIGGVLLGLWGRRDALTGVITSRKM